jgi:hypothetical protein
MQLDGMYVLVADVGFKVEILMLEQRCGGLPEHRRAEHLGGARAKLLELTLPRALPQLISPLISLPLHAPSVTECSCSAQLESSLSFLLGKSYSLLHFCSTIEG